MCAQRLIQKKHISHHSNEIKHQPDNNLSKNQQKSLRERVDELNFNIQRFLEEKQNELEQLEEQEKNILEKQKT